MKRLILVSAFPNRFHQGHSVPLGRWVVTDPGLTTALAQTESLRVQEVLDVKQGAMRYQSGGLGEICFITNPQDPMYDQIRRECNNPTTPRDYVSSYGPVFKLRTHYGILRWFVGTASGRHALRNLPLEEGYSFILSATEVHSNQGYTYWVPRITA